jgi:hypothetical protein
MSAAEAPSDEFAEVGQRLYLSLQTERMHLVRLSASLARGDEDATEVFQELVLRAAPRSHMRPIPTLRYGQRLPLL